MAAPMKWVTSILAISLMGIGLWMILNLFTDLGLVRTSTTPSTVSRTAGRIPIFSVSGGSHISARSRGGKNQILVIDLMQCMTILFVGFKFNSI